MDVQDLKPFASVDVPLFCEDEENDNVGNEENKHKVKEEDPIDVQLETYCITNIKKENDVDAMDIQDLKPFGIVDVPPISYNEENEELEGNNYQVEKVNTCAARVDEFNFIEIQEQVLNRNNQNIKEDANNLEHISMDAVIAEVVHRRQGAVAAVLAICQKRERLKKPSRLWSRPWLLRRGQQCSVLSMLFEELGPEDPASFTNFTRMQEPIWEELLALVAPLIQKENTVMREAVSPRDRLSVTLSYLATGNFFQNLSFQARVAANTVSKIVYGTLQAIVSVLENKAIVFPATAADWKLVSHKFDTLWNFPHCIGSVDGKHVNFRPPRKAGSKYRNYKGKYCIVLLALVDAEYQFLFVDVGRNGRMHDSAVLRESPLGEKLNAGKLNLPVASELPAFCYKMLFVIVGDDAFPLKENFLKPYPERGLAVEKRIFNYRLCRA